MPQTRNYSPEDINVIVGGRAIQGFGDGSYVKATRNGDEYTHKVGSRGAVARTHNLDRTGKITIGLLQTDPDNDYLSALQFGDIIEIDINDNNSGTTLVRGVECWLDKPADVDYAKESGNREYVFTVAKLESFSGGSIV